MTLSTATIVENQ